MAGSENLEVAAAPMDVDETRVAGDHDGPKGSGPSAESTGSSSAGSPGPEPDGNGSVHRFKCPFCPQSYTRSHNLKSHLLTHSQERPYTCPTCSSKFRRLHDLKRHLKLHTGEKPHVCDKCGRRFARGDALVRHLKTIGPCTEKQDGTESSSQPFEQDGAPAAESRATESPMYLKGTDDVSRPRPELIGPAYANELLERHSGLPSPSSHSSAGYASTSRKTSEEAVDARAPGAASHSESPQNNRTTLPSSARLVESLNLPPPIGLRLPAPFSRNPSGVTNTSTTSPSEVSATKPGHSSSRPTPPNGPDDPWSTVRMLEARIRVLEDRLYVAENRLAVLEGR